jgi:serine/threonine protein kinase
MHQITSYYDGNCSTIDYVGVPEWMAPELLGQQVSIDPRSDIYSVGVTAMELAFGKTPYHHWEPLKVICAILYPPKNHINNYDLFQNLDPCCKIKVSNPYRRSTVDDYKEETLFPELLFLRTGVFAKGSGEQVGFLASL